MGRPTILLLLPLVLVYSCAEPIPTESAEDDTPTLPPPVSEMLSALVGEWWDTGNEGGTVFHEHWWRAGEDSLAGLGFVMAGNDTVSIEELGIRWTATSAVYSARIPSQNNGRPIRFTATSTTADSLVFENPAHDFPQRIVYVPEGAKAWRVTVSGEEHGTPRMPRTLRYHLRPRTGDTL